MHLSKPWLRCLRMRQHHWLPRHGLPQDQAWLHLLHLLHHLHLHLDSEKNATHCRFEAEWRGVEM
jgi:hypothetical protein